MVNKRKHLKRKNKKSSFVKKTYRKFVRLSRKLIYFFCILIVVGGILFFFYNNDGLFQFFIHKQNIVTSREYDGIDVSKYQGKIEWNLVAQDENIQFVYIKASEGASKVDKKYFDYIQGAKNVGLKVGSYHYFIGRKTAKEQFNNFSKYVDKSSQDLIPMVDVEEAGNRFVSRKELQRNLNEFMQMIKEEYGKYPLLYSQYRFYKDKLSPEFDKYFLFIARYSDTPPQLNGSGKHNIWQYTEKGKIKGIEGFVDLDRLENGTKLADIELN